MADEPVVVIKTQPVKAGNGVEDKTKSITDIKFSGINQRQKPDWLRRGEVYFKCMKSVEFKQVFTSVPTGTDTAIW